MPRSEKKKKLVVIVRNGQVTAAYCDDRSYEVIVAYADRDRSECLHRDFMIPPIKTMIPEVKELCEEFFRGEEEEEGNWVVVRVDKRRDEDEEGYDLLNRATGEEKGYLLKRNDAENIAGVLNVVEKGKTIPRK